MVWEPDRGTWGGGETGSNITDLSTVHPNGEEPMERKKPMA